MSIKAADVKKLRDATGAGMMDSKKALVEANGDFEAAIEILRKKGQKVAAKRADRDSSEGAVIAKVNEGANKGVVVSLKCETDFVAKNEDFVNLAHQLAEKALNVSSLEELESVDFGGISVKEKLIEQTGVIGEKIEIGDFKVLEGTILNAYIHAGNKIASIVSVSDSVDGAADAARNVAMQVAAMNPLALDEGSIPQETIDKELEIAKDQLRQEGKPEQMLDKIAKGKLNKFFKENTLVHQAYIKAEAKESVQDYVKSVDSGLKVTGFVRVAI